MLCIFLPKFSFILVSVFWKLVMWVWFCADTCSLLGFFFQKSYGFEVNTVRGYALMGNFIYSSINSFIQRSSCFLKGMEVAPSTWLASRCSFPISCWADWLKGERCCPACPDTTGVQKNTRSNLISFMCRPCWDWCNGEFGNATVLLQHCK